jgi:hypothetical protein
MLTKLEERVLCSPGRAPEPGGGDGIPRTLELVPPGVVPIQEWRPATQEEANAVAGMRGGVAIKNAS